MFLSNIFVINYLRKGIEGWNSHDIKKVLYVYSENSYKKEIHRNFLCRLTYYESLLFL